MKGIPKILLVDDNVDNLKALEVVLRGLNAELIKVTSGNDALKATLHHDFALALLDVQMPEMDGYELANILKTEERTENLPFIFISAVYTDHHNISKGYTRGAYNFFAKPFDPETLVRSVELFIDKYNRALEQTALNIRLDERNREIQLKNHELERMNAELQSFVHVASHDLQEPLRKIHTYTNMIKACEHEIESHKIKSYFNRIETSVQRARQLIDDLLTYSQANNINKNFELTDLCEIVRSVEDEFKEILDEKKAIIQVPDTFFANVIPFQFRQVFHNLISNAVKYSSSARQLVVRISFHLLERGEINLNLSPHLTYYHISINDNGIGFPSEYNEKIFEMFQRLHKKSEYSGTGIGLAIVKKIIENHRGMINASGIPDEGATFNIYIPIQSS